ncbi:MAG: hypothetical protein KI791_13015 [Cyclobacteriaceae bacterium]|nr:hypothetical protein [Cyclobacteriaceae bacterium SS2]
MKNITLSADELLIEKAREKARREHTTLNERFRNWLSQYITSPNTSKDYKIFMDKHKDINSSRKFTREEMNER